VNWSKYSELVTHPMLQAALIVATGLLMGVLADKFAARSVKKMEGTPDGSISSTIIRTCRYPIRISFSILGYWIALLQLSPIPQVRYVVIGILASWAIFMWTTALFKVQSTLIVWAAGLPNRFKAITKQSIPAWEMGLHSLLVVIAAYFFFLAWEFDITGWLASAGILGVVIGFGAKDTVANLFAGVGILADSPYKLGDVLLLDTGERGSVSDIGLRSTRLLTLDEMEIIIPNSQMSTAKIINESGGPRECERIHIVVNVAYGTPVEQIRTLLLSVAKQTEGVLQNDPNRQASVQFIEMAEFSMRFKLLCFISHPEIQPLVIDRLNTSAYNALCETGIEIPFPKRDVRMIQRD
jgi:small-conductance mechanosensitive channel